MRITTLAVVLILFALVYGNFYYILDEFSSEKAYDRDNANLYEQRYETIVESINDNLEDTDEALNNISADNEAQFFTGTWNAILRSGSLVRNSFDATVKAGNTLSNEIGFTERQIAPIEVLIVLLVIGAVIGTILRWKA